MKKVSFLLDEELLKQLDELSRKTGLKKKEIAGRALESYLKSLEQSNVIKILSKE